MTKRKTTEHFVDAAILVHGDRYDYSLVRYTNSGSKVEIICKDHGVFLQTPNSHISKSAGCQKCYDGRRGESLKSTTEEFINRAMTVHGEKYDYSKVDYKSAIKKVKIVCPTHGVFEQTPHLHIDSKCGCRKCADEYTSSIHRYDFDTFISNAKKIHGDRYDYSQTRFLGYGKNVNIRCLVHGEFMSSPANHINGKSGCPKCGKKSMANISRKKMDGFISESKSIHGDTYDYSLVEYASNKKKVKIICRQHGVFEQTPSCHINSKAGCRTCSAAKSGNRTRKSLDRFISDSNFIHGEKYDYSMVEYVNAHTKVKIVCPRHGVFEQKPASHVSGNGCKFCSMYSGGEYIVHEYLTSKGLNFVTQAKFKTCVNISMLRFDFQVFINNDFLLLEIDGRQHKTPIKMFGGNDAHNDLISRDRIKNEWAAKNKIPLYRINHHGTLISFKRSAIDFLEKILTDHGYPID